MAQYKLEVTTDPQNMDVVMAFIQKHLQAIDNPKVAQGLILVGEELANNVFSYAYTDTPGLLQLTLTIDSSRRTVKMAFYDNGKAFNPLQWQTTSLKERTSGHALGGFGIMLSKRYTDKQSYIRENGKNMLVVEKGY